MFRLEVKNYTIILIRNPNLQTALKRPFAIAFFDNNVNKRTMTVTSFTSEKTALKEALVYKEQLELGKTCFEASMILNKK